METQWLTDASRNKCSVEYFGSKEKAQAALDSLKNCKECVNCLGCSHCSGCSYCSHCSGCSDCSGCLYCSHSSGCSGCSHCSYCSHCSHCSHCSGCSGCSRCSYCSDCSHCSGCSYCSDCSYCSHCSGCSGRKEEPLPVPQIKNIHQRIYKVASQPKALEMSTYHTCATTHCRAGWCITLAGAEGKKLEKRYNSCLAAMLIYEASGYKISPARFFDSNEDALADMKMLAGQ